jgi:hypothetical protein
MLWGVSWSAFRQGGYQAVWTGQSAIKGRLTGLLWGLVRLGSAIGVLLGGVLFDRIGYHATIEIFAGIALLAVPAALWIRWPNGGRPSHAGGDALPDTAPAYHRWRLAWGEALAEPVRRWLAAASFLEYMLSGIVISTTSIFLAERLAGSSTFWNLSIGVATVTGLLHGLRWLADLGLGPAMGVLSDRLGQGPTAGAISLVLLAGLTGAVYAATPVAVACLLLVLLCDGGLNVVMSAAASGAAQESPRPHMFVGIFTTMSDAGSALGPLLAYSAVGIVGLGALYVGFGAALCICLIPVWRDGRRQALIYSKN